VFARFTESARRVVVLAQEEARSLGHGRIGTEHLLLGLLRDEEGVAAHVLGSLGVTAAGVRDRASRLAGRGAGPTAAQLPFTPRAKKVLELALREALSLGSEPIGTEHVLLGLAREHEGAAAQILAELGADPERLRAQVLEQVGGVPALTARRRRFGRREARVAGFATRSHACWEYRVERCDELDVEWLNELGADGWELVGFERREGRVELVFKRRRGVPGSLRAAV
jgi:ATP-dependent Clp protease ATP-binding subunit ClpC